MIFKVSFSFNGPQSHQTHVFYFLSWNIKLKMDIAHIMWISLFCALDKFYNLEIWNKP